MPSQTAATLRSRYLEQAASDLDENRRLQRELTEKIEILKQEEELLIDILDLTERFPQVSESLAPSVGADTEPASTQMGQGLEAATHVGTSTSPRPAPVAHKEDIGGISQKGKVRQPRLGDLLTELLGGQQEPRLAQELREELLNKHPDRQASPQVVRNTLESLVAKGQIRRHKQKRSVLYTLVDSESSS